MICVFNASLSLSPLPIYRSAGSDVGGPVQVVQQGAVMAKTSPTALLGFAAALSINLAILNSLPFPALDGGQVCVWGCCCGGGLVWCGTL
jgi:membrane-associated protease RseP (regulator of RpoE activity)